MEVLLTKLHKKVYHAFRGIEENLKNFKQLSNEKQEALLIYLSNSYISILPFVFPYLNNSDIKMFVKKFRYLLKYSQKVELVSFRISRFNDQSSGDICINIYSKQTFENL